MAVPQGFTAGAGVVNLVNCKVRVTSSSAYGIDIQGCPGTTSKIKMVLRYSDIIGGGYSALVGDHACNPASEWICDNIYHNYARWTYLLENSTFTVNNYSTNSSLRGTSQYPAGYAPVPTYRCLYVGEGRQYSTVQAAYAAAGHGDNIVIYPGTYDCTSFSRCPGSIQVTKCVRFYGSTGNPDDVTLRIYGEQLCYGGHGFCFYPYYMLNVPVYDRAPGMAHLTILRSDNESWENAFGVYRTTEIYADPLPYYDEFWTEEIVATESKLDYT